MREIMFRGKRLDFGGWIFGYFMREPSGRILISAYSTPAGYWDWTEVAPDTVGQYTGLTDKNGVEIFEGDILRVDEPEFIPVFGIVRCGEYDLNVGFFVEWLNDRIFYRHDLRYWVERPYCVVCGNIHDNPELLKRSLTSPNAK